MGSSVTCWKCGQQLQLLTGEKVGRRESCEKCDADLHVCRNCRHFDPTSHNECRENQAEWVRFKDKNNYCDYFSPVAVVGRPAGRQDPAADARKKLDDLFKF